MCRRSSPCQLTFQLYCGERRTAGPPRAQLSQYVLPSLLIVPPALRNVLFTRFRCQLVFTASSVCIPPIVQNAHSCRLPVRLRYTLVGLRQASCCQLLTVC